MVSLTDYSSNGDWTQAAVQYGQWSKFAYAIEANYTSQNGQHINNEFDRFVGSARFKFQLTPNDTAFAQIGYSELNGGDLRTIHNPTDPQELNPDYSLKDNQEPNLLAGLHHRWQPGSHSLLLFGRLDDRLRVHNPLHQTIILGYDDAGVIVDGAATTMEQDYVSDLELYSVEAQHI